MEHVARELVHLARASADVCAKSGAWDETEPLARLTAKRARHLEKILGDLLYPEEHDTPEDSLATTQQDPPIMALPVEVVQQGKPIPKQCDPAISVAARKGSS